VQSGETLAAIARTYHTTPKAIAEANDLDVASNTGSQSRNEALEAETRLIIPIAPGKQTDTSTYARATTHYRVRKGDTVQSVAENFGVSPKMLRVWNRLKGDSLAGRRVLYLHLPVTRDPGAAQVAAGHSSQTHHHAATHVATQAASANAMSDGPSGGSAGGVVHHRVKAGETLYSIANSYNTTVAALKQANRDVATLRPGMILVVRDGH